jgi:hypothetical protein
MHSPLHSTELLLCLAFIAGAVQASAPDHWVPSSLLAWKRHWSSSRLQGFLFGALALHLALGVGLYFLMRPAFHRWGDQRAFLFAVAFLFGLVLMRSFRFPGLSGLFRSQGSIGAGVVTSLLLLGPSESLVPVMIKGHQLGSGYLLPSLAFAFGTLSVALGLAARGRRMWSRPLWLTRTLAWAHQKSTALPVGVALLVGFGILLRLR